MVWLLMGGVVAFFGVLGFVAYKMWDASFKNTAHIARQTGQAIDDVIWITERFKVVNTGGMWKIVFRRLKENTGSIEGHYWTKFVKKSKALNISAEEWRKKDVSRLIQRGIFLYETSEGVFFPMTITAKDGAANFKIIDQDNRMFLSNELRNNAELTRNPRSEMIKVIAIIIGFVLVAGSMAGGLYAMNAEGQRNIAATAQVCGEYARAVFNITMNGGTEYVGNIPYPGG
jgi:hypothetical protein